MMEPIIVPSKGRSDRCVAVKAMLEEGLSPILVLEPDEEVLYSHFDCEKRVLPWKNQGIAVIRNWIVEQWPIHWQIDDDVSTWSYRDVDGIHKTTFTNAFNIMESAVGDEFFMIGPCYMQELFNVKHPGLRVDRKVSSVMLINRPVKNFCMQFRMKSDLEFFLSNSLDGRACLKFENLAFRCSAISGHEGGCKDDYDTGEDTASCNGVEKMYPELVDINIKNYWQLKVNWRRFDANVRNLRAKTQWASRLESLDLSALSARCYGQQPEYQGTT